MLEKAAGNFTQWLHKKFNKLLYYKHFDKITGIISLINPVVVAMQLYAVIIATNVEAVSISMFSCFIMIQLTFGFVALKAKNFGMIISMILSMLISASIIIITLIKRY